jgi:hypothetical protein
VVAPRPDGQRQSGGGAVTSIMPMSFRFARVCLGPAVALAANECRANRLDAEGFFQHRFD